MCVSWHAKKHNAVWHHFLVHDDVLWQHELSVKLQGCLRDDTLAFKAVLEGLDCSIEEEATWAREMVTELYPTCHDVQTLLLTKLCSDGDVSLALGTLQMYYDVVADMPELSKALLQRLLTGPGEWLFMHLHTIKANQHE